MSFLNLGIVAHVDAGKTTLTERLLFETGVSTHLGRVDHGDTVADADALERQRGITIRSAVVAFTIGDVKVNLIDTPGHSDFIAEVERALGVLDGAVLVVSAVEGVQAQTRVLIRTLERLQMPFLVFVNKIDRLGATDTETMAAIRESLTGDAVTLTQPVAIGCRSASVRTRVGADFLEDVVEKVSEHDDQILSQYVDSRAEVSEPQALAAMARLTLKGRLHPVYFGSALSGVGVAHLIDGLISYLPTDSGAKDDPLHGMVFKIERDPSGHKVAFVRLFAGSLAARDQVHYSRCSPTGVLQEGHGRATRVRTIANSTTTTSGPASAGDIAQVVGLSAIEIGDQLGTWDPTKNYQSVASPGLESVVLARHPADQPALFNALRQLCEQDPLIAVKLDGVDGELTVSLYGEVQKEVLAARLANEYGVDAVFLPTKTVYIERVTGVGHACRIIGSDDNAEFATVGLRVEPGGTDSGVRYQREVELGGLPLSFHTAIEMTVSAALRTGLHGWEVSDCVVTLTDSGFWSTVSAAGHFRRLTAIVLCDALGRAGTEVCAPVSEFEVDIPTHTMSQVLKRLVAFGATPNPPEARATRTRILGAMPTDRVHAFKQRLPGLTGGEGSFIYRAAGYEPVPGPPPARAPKDPHQ